MKKFLDYLASLLLLTLGSTICAFSVNSILLAHSFLSSGITGIALFIYYLNPFASLGIIYLLINIPIFIIGWFFVGPRFIFFTAFGMVIFSIMLQFVKFNIPVEDKMLAAFIGGGITGLGVGIMLKSYGSSGGSEILSIILSRMLSISLGTGILIINTFIMGLSLFLFPIENVFYTIIYIFVSAKMTDTIFHGMSKRKVTLIISDNWEEILEFMTDKLGMRVTIINGIGGYEGGEKPILYSIMNRNKVLHLKKLVKEKDKNAFVAILDASDVSGVEIGNQPRW